MDSSSADTGHVALELGRLLGPLRRAVLRATRNAEGLPDLPEAQIELLRALSAAPDGLAPREAAARLRIAPSTVSNLVRTMTAAGLVERISQPHDLRTVTLTASATARELLERYDSASTAALVTASAELPAADRAALAAAMPALDRLLLAMERQGAAAARQAAGQDRRGASAD
ncbi:MarR family winged helix-turn-helix transcriptional regulator [Streptomyces niger]|uniref:MarR family winged helix-turn-helix transcriptional regulator n=1 Tax=Streptomyces niger TaxID=66373 RepID=UPI00069C77A4|nr:helix-turn-helix domain-containing protein [Streptomyces niger]